MGIRLLILGANGQVGHSVMQHAKPALLDTLDGVAAYGRDKVDFTRPDTVVQALKDVRPDVIINAAAYTAVEKAEAEPQLARQVNADTLGVLAEQAKKQDAMLVHYSTDYVFDGTSNRPYLETDPTNPLSVYGRTKLEGEQVLQQVGGHWVVFRTSWVYAQRGGNFAKTMVKLAQTRDQLQVVDDQQGAPTSAAWLAELGLAVAGVAVQSRYRALGKLAPGFLPDNPRDLPSGEVFHATAAGHTTWFDYANLVLDLAHKKGLISKRPEVLPAKTADMGFKAQRPAYSVLDTTKLQAVFKITPPDWTRGVKNLMATLDDVG